MGACSSKNPKTNSSKAKELAKKNAEKSKKDA